MSEHDGASYPLSTLVRLNELLGELRALHEKIPGLPAGGTSRDNLRTALDEVRKIVAHSVATALAKEKER